MGEDLKKRILISHPGFSNFQFFFKQQSQHNIFLHRNYDLNSATFRLCRAFRSVKLLEKLNTKKLISSYRANKIQRLIVIKGCTVDYEMLDKYGIKYTIYVWDSIKNIYRGSRYISMKSKVVTFDLNDSINYNFQYLPLFHFRGENPEMTSVMPRKIISMYGSYSRDRVSILNHIFTGKQILQPLEFVLTITLFTFLKELIIGKQSFKLLWKYTTFRELKREQIESMLQRSLATLDVANPNQSGMTTRTLEALSYGTKLITNNLTTFNFCKSNDIPVIAHKFEHGLGGVNLKEFLYQEIHLKPAFINAYCINSFLNQILSYKH